MATEVGSDIALIQDEDMLRKMWQQTEDFGKKKEIRMRMYKLREQRLKEFYTTGEMIQTETTSKRSSTRTHTESITDQGFMTMKTKEIRDSESPTEDYQRQSNANKNYYVSSKIDESDGNRGIVEIEQASSLKPNEEYTQNSLQTSMSSSTSTKWKSSQTTISVSEEVQKAEVNLNSKFIVNEQNNEDSQLTYDTSYNNSDSSNIDSKVTESISTTNVDNIKRDDNNKYSNVHQKVEETYTSNGEQFEPVSENISNADSNFIENTYISNISSNKSEHFEIATDNKIINELQKLDSYLSTQQSTTDSSTKSNSIVSNDDKIIKKVEDKVIDTSKEHIEGQYITTHQHSYQPPRISVDLSPSHDAFAKSLRSTPERSSPSPSRERISPERRFKSASPEKYRASPEKSGSPSKSLNYSTRRRLSSTQTKGLSKKRSITPTRGEKYDSSDDSDCSGATHGTYDKYKGCDAKKTLFKEEKKITSTSKYGQKSSSTSPVRREKSPGYSSEGSVGKEVRKSSPNVKNSSHESSPERSAFKPVNNYKTLITQQVTQDNKINRITQEDNVYTNNYNSKNKISADKHLIKVIKPEIDNDLNEKENENTESTTKNTENNIINLKNNSIQEKFITQEQVCISVEQVDTEKITTQPTSSNDINKSPRDKSPSKSVRKENKTKQDEFIENEKSNVVKQSNIINDVITIKPKEKSPVKEIKPVTKDTKKYPTIKSSENISYTSDIKSVTPSKKTISTVPSSIPSPTKKVVPSTLEKTPSKKNLIHKDSKDTLLNKTVKKDLSRDKMDIKITRSDSKTLIHKNSKERITPKMVVKKPSHELLVDKKTTISSRQKVTSPETKTKTLETIKILEKKDSKNKLKPSISPQSSQKKLVLVKSIAETKIVDSKKTTGNIYSKRIPSLNVTKPRTHTSPKSDINETPTRVTKPHTKTISTSSIAKPQIKKTTYYNSNKTSKVEITKNVGQKSNDLENELPPDNFESDTDLDDSTNKPKYIKNISSNSSTSSSSSDEDDEDRDDIRKIQDIDNIRIEAEEEYGKKMTNKDALLNVIVQLPPSSRESSPEYSARFGQPYCSVSDDASLPRYADVVSEPEDANDYSLHSNRYDVVTDLDEESNVTVADRVSKFLNNVNKQEEIQKTTEIPQSPQAVRKTKQIFESIAKGKTEETDINDVIKSETMNIKNEEVHDLSKINNTPSSVLTRKISGASDYKTRKDFFENKKSNDISEKVTHLTPTKITRSSSIKDRRASFETKIDKKTPLKDKTNVPRTKSPESKSSSPDRTTKTPIKISKTETFDVKVEEINRSRRLSGSKSVKDRTATFEKNEPTQKLYKENKTTFRHQVPNTPLNTSKISETRIKTATVTDTKTADRVLSKRVRSPEKPSATDSIIKTNESTSKKVPSKSPDRKITETPKRNSTAKSPDRQITETPKRNSTAKSPDRQITEAPKRNSMTKSPERSALIKTKEDTSENRSTRDTISSSSRQRATITTAKTEFGVTTKNSSTPKTTLTTTTTQSISIQNADDEVEIEEIFDLHILETMLEKAVGYDRRRRIRAQIRVVKRQLETNSGKATNTTTRVTKNFQDVLPAKTQKQSNVTVEKTENVKKLEVKKERSVSPQKTYANPIGNSRSPSPQKTLRSVVETRTPLPTQKAVRTIENERSNSSQKTVISVEKVQPLSSQKITPIEKVRSPSPQKITSTEKVRSPSPKKISVVQKQQDSRFNKNEKSSRNSTITSTSTTVTKTTKVKSEQVSSSSTNLYQEQNVTDLITSSYGVGPTDDNGRPLFGLRALRKTNANQSVVSETDSSSSVHYEAESRDTQASDQKNRSFGLRALQSENTYTVQESSSTVYQTASDQKGGVDQLITDHKGKPLFGLKALQSIGKNEEEPIYDDMPEPPVSPQLKDLVLKHEKHAKESSKLESQPRQKPKAKFRDSFILDTKDEGLYSTFEENGFTDPNEITSLRSIIKKSEDDQNNETIVKSKSQSTVFQSKSVMRSDGSGNVSVTQDFLKGELSSVNEQEPSGKLTRGHYTYQSPDNLDAKKGIAKVTTVTTAIGKDTGPQITEITEELSENDHVDGNKVVKRSRTNDKFENIQKRFSQESFSQDSRRSSKELNGHEKSEVSPQSTPRSSLVRGDSIKALQHKFQQATVSSSLKQNKTAKSDVSSNSRQVEEKTVTTKVNTTKNSGTATSFLDNNSRVTGVQDVLTRMRNADLVVESGDTHEDIEARALLNKFLGASVILHGMEQGNKSPASINTTSSAALVNQVEKQRAQKSPVIRKNLNEQELDNIWDEKQLQILLESCPDYDQRKKIRARLRQIMAEHKACTDVVALAGLTDNTTSNGKNGELLKPMCNLNVKPIATAVDDSGTESGEEVNQKILVQVQGALANLESALPALDPLRRSSVVELLTKLQTSLKLSSADQTGKPTPPPRKCWNRKTAGRQDRHTVGVSSEELQDARRWLEENGYGGTRTHASSTPAAASARNTPRSYEVAAPKTFRPVKFVPPPPKRTNHLAEDCVIPEPSRHALQNCNSFACPPAQHVIVEDLDCKRRKTSTTTTISIRDSSDSSAGGSSSSSSSGDDDDDEEGRSVSSAQRLLQFASNDHCRKLRVQGKRVKLKRGAAGERERSSGDDDEYRPRRVPHVKEPPPATTSGGGVPLFEPKTANDKKYLALLRHQAETDEKAATASAYNPLQGKLQGNWGNRFGRIKTTFERRIGDGATTTASAAVSPNKNVAKTFWHDICKCPSDDSINYYRSKKIASFKPNAATDQWAGQNRGFSHGARSAFKPVQQQQQQQLKQQQQQFAPLKPVPKIETSLLEPPRTVAYPKRLPLYNSSVTTAHRPFVYSDASDEPVSPPSPYYECVPQPATVVSRVMGSPQTATLVKSKQRSDHVGGGPTQLYTSPSLKTISAPVRQPVPAAPSVKEISAHHKSQPSTAPKPPTRSPRVVTQQRSPTTSPVRMPSVLQKSESWHQMIVGQSRAAARSPLPHIPAATPVRHASAPYEGFMQCKREIAQKQSIVRQHLLSATESSSASRRTSPKVVKLNDDIDKVDDTFESLFKEATRPSK